jgi:hypothetical protein
MPASLIGVLAATGPATRLQVLATGRLAGFSAEGGRSMVNI